MLKLYKQFLVLLLILFIAWCKNNQSDPTQVITPPEENGNYIPEGMATADASQISSFLNKYNGIYYYISDYNGDAFIKYRVEGGKIYSSTSTTEVAYKKTLYNNKLQIDEQTESAAKIYILNFFDNRIKYYEKQIYEKENYTLQQNFKPAGEPVAELQKYAGNYFINFISIGQKTYEILIDNNGQVYKQYVYNNNTVTLEDNILSISYDYLSSVKRDTYILEQNRLIKGDSYIDNVIKEDVSTRTLSKADLLSTYKGTYKSTDGNSQLNVYEYSATLNINGEYKSGTSILLGTTLTKYVYNSTSKVYEQHKIVFNNDQAVYTSPDGQTTVTLTKENK